MHTLTIALLGACAMAGVLRWHRQRMLRYIAVTCVLTMVAVGGPRVLFATALRQEYVTDHVLTSMRLSTASVDAVVHRVPPATLASNGGSVSPLENIRQRDTIRVGYLVDAMPFAFFNDADDLVGFDIELAHQLARELGVRLELVPVERDRLSERLNDGYCDITMSGVAITTERAGAVLFSSSYLDETLAFVTDDATRDDFVSWDRIREQGRVAIAVPDLPYYVDKLRQRLPNAALEIVPDVAAVFAAPGQFAAVAMPAERGSAWTLLHPAFSVVVPGPDIVKVPLAYPVAQRGLALVSFVNTWIELKQKDGTIDALYSRWILGRQATMREPRWSIVRNVLHWME